MVFTLEDYLMQLHPGQWFGFNNLNGNEANKTFANLRFSDKAKYDDYSRPTEQECIDGVAALQATWDGNAYQRTRAVAYTDVKEQLDQLYHDMTAGKLDATGEWHKAIKAVKDATPKPE